MHPDDLTLGDYADNALSRGERARVDEHLAACAECRALIAGLGRVASAAAGLKPLEPPPEAWNRIERGIRASGPPRRAPRWPWLAAAAALVVATLVGLRAGRIAPFGDRTPPGAERAGEAVTAQSVEAELLMAEQHYQNAINGLEQIANAGKGALDPQTAATLEKNLAVVDQAISESRAALRTQPGSEPAQASLLDNFKTKIALLEDTVALINEMRKGNEAGAGRIASGLKQKGS